MTHQLPRLDEIELTLFGPGFGECIVLHVGSGEWLVVDSCIDNTGAPAALRYLQDLGVDIATAVKILVASHWHDDHIGGLSKVFKAASSAKFVTSAAMAQKEFLSLMQLNRNKVMMINSGTSEWDQILYEIESSRSRRKHLTFTISERILYRRSAIASVRGCEVVGLSPTDAAFKKAVVELSTLMPQVHQPKIRARSLSPNNNSVVLWLDFGDQRILLGADLEEAPGIGWSVLVTSPVVAGKKAEVFKVAHHGSANGHFDAVWKDMLVPSPFALVTPFNRLRAPLPTQTDINRLKGLTANAYTTAKFDPKPSKVKISKAVDKTMLSATRSLRKAPVATGFIRMRQSPGDPWRIEMNGSALKL